MYFGADVDPVNSLTVTIRLPAVCADRDETTVKAITVAKITRWIIATSSEFPGVVFRSECFSIELRSFSFSRLTGRIQHDFPATTWDSPTRNNAQKGLGEKSFLPDLHHHERD